jgi:Na+/melibiose symporter-like transporter
VRTRLSHLLAWGASGLPVAALGLPLVVYLPPHYAGTLGLPLATVGLIFALVRLVDIPIDPLLGALMDNSRTRIGQFRPWMLGGAAILMLGVWLVFQAEPGVTATRTFATLLLLYLGWSCISLSQVSWGSRLSPDYAERARIFGYWTAFNVLGTLTVLFIPPLVDRLAPDAGPGAGIRAMGWFILALAPLAALLAAATVPEGEAPATSHRVALADVRRVLSDPRMVRLLLVDLLLSMAPGVTGALFLFFLTAARGLPPATASALLLPYFIFGLIAAPLWVRLAASWGKHRATALAGLWKGAAILAMLLLPSGNVPLAVAAMALAGVPFAAATFLLRSMLADLNDAQLLDRRADGQTRAETTGLNFAILTATQKLGYAIPVGLIYPILSAIGFDPKSGTANSDATLRGLELLFALPPLILCTGAAILIWKWPITAQVHAGIRACLAQA